jgi:hypothetical protein
MKSALAVMFLSSAVFATDFPSPEALPSSVELPDPLAMRDGTRISSAEDWSTKRKPELRALFEHYMYGRRPRLVSQVSAKVLREDKAALAGKATLREVMVDLGLGEPVHLLVMIPNQRKGPAPCFLGLNFAGNYALLDDPQIAMPRGWIYGRYTTNQDNRAHEAGRGAQKDTWAIEETIVRGYAVATFYNGDVVPDHADLAAKVLRQMNTGASAAEKGGETATIMAWAWALSRMLDYLETVPEIDARRVATFGHSRHGKTALVAAAFDDRFAMTIPNQAGCGGTAPSRVPAQLASPNAKGNPTAETIAVINRNFPHWFCANFKAFNETPERLPFDQHALIALCAPRPVLLSNATADLWANPAGQFEMLRAADPVYRLVAGEGISGQKIPPVGELMNSRLGYFIREGKHAMTRRDWAAWLDYADRWLRQ